MAGKNIQDREILEALTGTGSADPNVVEALRGSSAVQRRADNEVLEALGGTPARITYEGELPVQKRGDEFEAVAIWAAKEAADRAVGDLAQVIMRADGNKGIYAAEAEAKGMAEEAYAEAAKHSPYELNRQQQVAHVATKLAEMFTRRQTSNRRTK